MTDQVEYTVPATTPAEREALAAAAQRIAADAGLVVSGTPQPVPDLPCDPVPAPMIELLHLQGNGWAILCDGEKYVRPGGRPFPSMNAAAQAAAQAFGCPADHPWERAPGVVSIYRQHPAG